MFDDKNIGVEYIIFYIFYVSQDKMVDVIFIVKHLFYLKFFITFIIATRVY